MTDLLKRWVAALRSGDYEQGKSQLRNIKNEYCCLGVLCDVIDPTQWGKNYHGKWGYPHETTLEFAGIEFDFAEELASINDRGVSFQEISNIIEEHYK